MCTEEAAVLALIMEVCGCQVLTQVLPGGCMVAKGQKIGLWVATIETVDVPKVAICSPNVFRIRPHLAEKSTTLLFRGTFGHTVHKAVNKEIKVLYTFLIHKVRVLLYFRMQLK